MQPLDASTLLLVNALFNGFAAAGWGLLAFVFRMAPRASGLMVALHLSRVLALSMNGAGWPFWLIRGFSELASLLTLSMLGLAVRRMLRLGSRWHDIAAIAGVTALVLVVATLLPLKSGALIVVSVGMALLSAVAARDLLAGAGPGLASWVTALLLLPYIALTAFCLARVGWLLSGGATDAPIAEEGYISPRVGALWLVLTMSISLSLMALLVWRLVGRVEHLTLRDAMTNTLNRRAISDEMQRLQALRQRGHPYAVILIDIDHFKSINDQWGHAAGDAALLHFIAVVGNCLRELDLLGRLGGEEFCALLPHTRVSGAAQVAERMRSALQARPLVWHETEIAITASFGVVAGQGDDPQGEASLALADRQVYRAKDEGRNRVCVALESTG